MRSILLSLLLLLSACAPQAPAPTFRTQDVTGAGFARELRLQDTSGAERTLADYRGKVSIVTFGYTHCPDVCPATLGELASLLRELGDDAKAVQVLFVTLDPERDTPDVLARYAPAFHPSFVALRGDAARTAETAREFKLVFARRETGSAAGYALDHSAGSYVYDRQGRLRLYLPLGTPREAILHDLRLLLR